MQLTLLRRAASFFGFAGAACLGSALNVLAAPADRHPAKEDTYTITSVLKIVPPVDPAVMNDDFQDVRVLARDAGTVTLEVTYYPLCKQAVGEDANWRKDDAGMSEYLRPTPAENWDDAMRRDLVAQLRQDGINPDTLTDKQLVTQVSRWAMQRAHMTNAFGIWDIYYPGGKPTVYPALREAFNAQKPDPKWTDQQMFDQEALGKSMFYGKVHGSCTSSSIYLTTLFRALGIPTRTILCVPPFDPNDPAQAQLFYSAVHNNLVRETVRRALGGMTGQGGFDNHLFNEVYVGHRWVRLNYDNLGQPILDENYFGLLTHIDTSSDMSKMPLAATWGLRYAGIASQQPKLSSVNPYMLLSVQDHFGANAPLANPTEPDDDLRLATITGLYPKNSALLPSFVVEAGASLNDVEFFLVYKGWVPGGTYRQMGRFWKHVGHDILLTAPGQPNVTVQVLSGNVSQNDGSFQAFCARIAPEDKAKVVPGIAYTLVPQNTSDTYRWAVTPGVTVTLKDKP